MSTVTVGDQIANGTAVVASVDTDDLVTSVTIPAAKNWMGVPLGVTISPSVTVEALEALLSGNPPDNGSS